MSERQRPRQTARAPGNSLTSELVEQRQSLEQLACFPPNDSIDLCRGHTGRRQQSKVYLCARSYRDRAVSLAHTMRLLERFEIDLQTKCRLRPHRSIERQTAGCADGVPVN